MYVKGGNHENMSLGEVISKWKDKINARLTKSSIRMIAVYVSIAAIIILEITLGRSQDGIISPGIFFFLLLINLIKNKKDHLDK